MIIRNLPNPLEFSPSGVYYLDNGELVADKRIGPVFGGDEHVDILRSTWHICKWRLETINQSRVLHT